MNRFMLKYAYPITFAILAVLEWVVYREFSVRRSELIPFAVVAVLVWGLGTLVFIYFWPRITYSAFKRAVQHGLGGDPIPVNTLYSVPTLASPSAPTSSLLATGTDEVLDLGGRSRPHKGPAVFT